MTFGICFPVGVLAEGAVAEVIGVRGALGAVAALLAIVLAFVTPRRLLPRIDPQLSAAPAPR